MGLIEAPEICPEGGCLPPSIVKVKLNGVKLRLRSVYLSPTLRSTYKSLIAI